MKKFRFRLQRVLEAKLSLERQAQRELGDALAALDAKQKKLDSLQADLSSAEEEQRKLMRGAMRAGDAMIQHQWHQELRKQIRRQGEAVVSAAKIVEEARQRLIGIQQERRVLEKLREKRLSEHKTMELASSQAILDDVGARQRLSTSLAGGGSASEQVQPSR